MSNKVKITVVGDKEEHKESRLTEIPYPFIGLGLLSIIMGYYIYDKLYRK